MRPFWIRATMFIYSSFGTTLLLLIISGCTTIRPAGPSAVQLHEELRTFSHDDFDRVLRRFVNDQGQVNYAALKNEPHDLDRYYELVSVYSPDSHPALFPSDQSRLAYWLNAYNAAVIKAVLTYYPISSVADIRPPVLGVVLPSQSGFFLLQRVTFGGKTTNLYFLEHGVIRKRFADPRVHFALNCASGGCPHLPRQVFSPEHLNEQLDRETRRFVAEGRNVAIDHETRTVILSSIFDWYEGDFLTWLQHVLPGQPATLRNYIALYLPSEATAEWQRAALHEIRFRPYDWGLNDQRRAATRVARK